jgi:hypothetical protein
MVYVADVDCVSEAAAVFDDGLTVEVGAAADGFDIVELWGPVDLWSWAQVKAWAASLLRRSGEVADVLDWCGSALVDGCDMAGIVAERLRAVEARKRLVRAADAAAAAGEVVKASALRQRAEAVKVPAEPAADDWGGDGDDLGGGGGLGVARWRDKLVKAKLAKDRAAVETARGWVRWYRTRDRGIKPGRAADALERVPLVTLPAVEVTLADCVDAARGALPEGVDWQEVKLWPSDWEADEGRDVDWAEVREAALERDAPAARWVNADPCELAQACVAEVVNRFGASGAWDWWRWFKALDTEAKPSAVLYMAGAAVDGRLSLSGRWVSNPPTLAVQAAAARLVGRELWLLLDEDAGFHPAPEHILRAIDVGKAQRAELEAEAKAARALALARWRSKRRA